MQISLFHTAAYQSSLRGPHDGNKSHKVMEHIRAMEGSPGRLMILQDDGVIREVDSPAVNRQ